MPELVTNEEKLEARRKFQHEQILGGKSQATFADMGICTAYKIVLNLGSAHSDEEADLMASQVADCIVTWLQHEQDVWIEMHGAEKMPARRLPVGDGLSVGKKKNIRLTPDSKALPTAKIVHVIEYNGSVPFINLDQNKCDEVVYKDMCELYVTIACDIGPFPALIVVGNHQWHATMNGNDAEFVRQELGVTSIPKPTNP